MTLAPTIMLCNPDTGALITVAFQVVRSRRTGRWDVAALLLVTIPIGPNIALARSTVLRGWYHPIG